MRKKFLVSAVLALLLMLLCSTAWAAYCTACGVSISDSAHLCPRCGARQMPDSAAVAITRIHNTGDGTVTVSWSGGAGPYTLSCVQKRNSDIAADLADSAGMGFQPASPGTFSGHSGTADWLVPGLDYWIAVCDAKGRLVYQAWIPGQAPVFPDFPVSMTLQLQSGSGADRRTCSVFSAGAIAADPVTACSADVLLTFPEVTDAREIAVKVCITAPNGIALTDTVTDMHIAAGSHALRFACYDLSRYFSRLLAHYGCVPAGEYTFAVYFGGMYAGSQTFCVAE